MHSIELEFGMYITDHRRTNPIDFGECRIYSFFIGVQKKSTYSLRSVKSNYYKCVSV